MIAGTRFSLQGKVALVTGGSRGIGRSIALGFASAGADILITSRNKENCDAVAREITQATGQRAEAVACHIGRWEDIDALVQSAYQLFPSVDVLVNNAGMAPLYESLEGVSEALFDKVIAVNLRGPFRLGCLVGTRMAAGQGGTIINISSVAAVRPDPETLPYAVAKAAMNALTVGFSRSFGPMVRTNCIMPGRFQTDVSKHWDEAAIERELATTSLRRVAEPREIVETALYLASDASSYTTGAIIRVDGGFAA